MSTNGQGNDLSPDDPVESVNGIGKNRGETLREQGIETVADLQRADVTTLSAHLPPHVASEAKETVGDNVRGVTTGTEARKRARDIPGAKGKTVRVNGSQEARVLERDSEQNLPGAHMEVHKG